jgi:vitamin B12/bleomycin/antimicrobial peptide transport system ATP-binding/permease protein
MAEQSSKPAVGSESAKAPARDSLASELLGVRAAFWASPKRNKILMLFGALVAVVGATAYAQVRLNAWNQPFYNALAHKDFSVFVEQLGVFAELAGVLLVLNVAQTWLNQTSKVVLRAGLVNDLMTQWLSPTRAFRLSNAGEIGANPDQRIQQDAQHLTDLSTDLGIGLLQSTLLLLSFIGVLWVLSSHMLLSFAGHVFSIPGYMVWCALIYAGAASFLSWRVGRPLIDLNAERYAREAEFRSAIVRVNENIDGVTLYRGEADERETLVIALDIVLGVSRRIVSSVTRLTWITAGYGWFTIAAPILVAAPAYFLSGMSFGELMVVVGAFNQVQTALRWYVDNFSGIADWRATLLRVASFRQAIVTMDELGQEKSRITFVEAPDESIEFDDLHIASPAGCLMVGETRTSLNPQERTLITGENGEERALLFRAIGGLWPWGHGRITQPARQNIMFMPIRAYIPPGSLRAAITYPHSTDLHEDSVVVKALADVGLEHLEPLLDMVERWDRRLTDDEKQCLAFARVVLHRPLWVVVQDAFDVLDPKSRLRIRGLITGEYADIGFINIGHERPEESLYVHRLHLMMDPLGPSFEPEREHGLRAPTESTSESPAAE